MSSRQVVPGLAVCAAAALLLFLSSAHLFAQQGPKKKPRDLSAEVDALFAEWDQPTSPGCAVGIIHNGKLIYRRGFGSANLDYEVPNTPRTVYDIGSFSKAFTCQCIAMLLDQGKISADDDIRRWVPEMHKFDPPIRIRHLIRCHSGVWAQFHIMPLAGWDNMPIHSPFTEGDVLAVLSGQKKLPFEPGKKFQYGSGDYFLLGLIVRRASGQSLAAFAEENIFKPLGMKQTHFEEDPSFVVKHRAVGHYRYKKDAKWRLWTNHGYLPGGSGLKTCVDDLYRWDQNFSNNRLATGKHHDEFIKQGTLLGNRFCLDADAFLKKINPANKTPAGQYRGLKRIQFTGGLFGMSAVMAQFPEERFTVICLTNTEDIRPWRKAEEIADLYLADKLKPKPSRQKQNEKEVKPPLEELRNKVGAYQSDGGVVFKVHLKDGKLFNDNLRGETYRLKPLSATRFQPTAYPNDRFVFHRPAPGEPFALKLEWTGGTIPFSRVELVDPDNLKLEEYAGEYLSDELAATYRFKIQDNALWLRVHSRRWERLESTVRDDFIPSYRYPHENRRLRFRRDKDGQVTGFTISFWRIKGVDFAKQ